MRPMGFRIGSDYGFSHLQSGLYIMSMQIMTMDIMTWVGCGV